MKLREHWHVVQQYSHHVDVAIVIILAGAGIWFVRSRLRRRTTALQELSR